MAGAVVVVVSAFLSVDSDALHNEHQDVEAPSSNTVSPTFYFSTYTHPSEASGHSLYTIE
ncbi:hypothetical protein E2C01_007312 [Portunus trituberculatus]|uniref:Uncharacterized protein n=1 Tax=Portunus trituberculatus TaxID=210409 RepID=A0A5B7D0M3_PORTR|nr:hypothetical protein [Portunus trituberculatus]